MTKTESFGSILLTKALQYAQLFTHGRKKSAQCGAGVQRAVQLLPGSDVMADVAAALLSRPGRFGEEATVSQAGYGPQPLGVGGVPSQLPNPGHCHQQP